MSDPFVRQLSAIAPDVDIAASRAMFERRAAQANRSRRLLLSAAAVALIAVGVIGVLAIAGRGIESDPASTADGESTVPAAAATGDEFEVIAVEATAIPFGTIDAVGNEPAYESMWSEQLPGATRPDVDFDASIVVAFTLPDDACPDILTRFRVDSSADGSGAIWEPQFEPPPGGCNEPLITRTYVAAVDRVAAGRRITFQLPADDVYGYPASSLTLELAPTVEPGAEVALSPTLTPTGLTVELPPAGRTRSEWTQYGPIWVVHHDDGAVSVLPGIVPDVVDDDTGVTNLARLVVWDASSRVFSGRWVHDEFGRSVNGPRTDDLVGYAARVDGTDVEILLSDADVVPGDALEIGVDEFDHPLPPLTGEQAIALDVLPTLSSLGPIWRHLDATLVVQNGVGTLCDIDTGASVDQLATCSDGVPTAITSRGTSITSWFFAPVYAEFDEFGEIVQVAPTGGRASRNESVPDVPVAEIEVIIEDVVGRCRPPDEAAVLVTLVAGWPVDVDVEVTGGQVIRGSTAVALADGTPLEVNVPVDAGLFGIDGMIVVRSTHEPEIVLASREHVGCG